MSYDPVARSKNAAKQERGPHGYFLPKEGQVKSSVKSSGAGINIGKLFKAEKAEDDESLVSLKVSNPLSRIIQILQDIKNKQATTVSMRFTIPLIALPIVFLVAFQLGRGQASCQFYQTSVIGSVKNIIVMKQPSKNLFTRLTSFMPLGQDKLLETSQPILITDSGEVITIDNRTGIDLKNLESKLIVTGNYSSCTKTLTLDNRQNIQEY